LGVAPEIYPEVSTYLPQCLLGVIEHFESRVGIHKHFGARKKTGSEWIFWRIDFKISFFPFLQMLFTEKVTVLADFFKKIDLFEKD
jgi:hypothetical protein